MAKTKRILNLDEVVADVPESGVVWRGVEYPVASMSVDTYLRYVAMEASLRETLADSGPAAQMQLYLDIFALMVPDLPLDEIKAQPLQVVTKLADFVMAAVGDMTAAGGAPVEAGNDEQPGE